MFTFFPLKVRKLHQHHRRQQRRPLLRCGVRGKPDEYVTPVRDPRARPPRPHVSRVGTYTCGYLLTRVQYVYVVRFVATRWGAPVTLTVHRGAVSRAYPVHRVHVFVLCDEGSRAPPAHAELLRRVRRVNPSSVH